jgi:hypothetical protein
MNYQGFAMDNNELAILNIMTQYAGLPMSELAFAISKAPNETIKILNTLVRKGYLCTKQYAGHTYYCGIRNKINVIDKAILNQQNFKQKTYILGNKLDKNLKYARTCYGHLAGELGVAFTEHLIFKKIIIEQNTQFYLTDKGYDKFYQIGLNKDLLYRAQTNINICLDATERQFHIAGELGVAITHAFLERYWLKKSPNNREICLTEEGKIGFYTCFEFNF